MVYFNRELSWLSFNERVLLQAKDQNVPLFERLRFMSIFVSNLDEFFMVRVGGLVDQKRIDPKAKDSKTYLTAHEQLMRISVRVKQLMELKDSLYQSILKEFQTYSIYERTSATLSKTDETYLQGVYLESIKPFLSPQILDKKHLFPHLVNKQCYIFVSLEHKETLNQTYGLIPLPDYLPELTYFAGKRKTRFIILPELIHRFMGDIFNEYTILEDTLVKVIRNADLDFEKQRYDEDKDFRDAVEDMLKKRKRLLPVMLVLSKPVSESFRNYLIKAIKVDKHHLYHSSSPLDFSFLASLEERLRTNHFNEFFYEPFLQSSTPDLDMRIPLIPQIFKKDVLLSYPYQQITPLLKLLQEAIHHPDVISIKITLYRLASNSRIVDMLIDAANSGKEVSVLIELRARFDEAYNVEWSRRLEDSLVNVSYGFDYYKVHSKIMLIGFKSRRNVRYIAHFGTGNYNEKTARLYTDYNLITADPDMCNDAHQFFTQLFVASADFRLNSLLASPYLLKQSLLAKIYRELDLHRLYRDGHIIMKMNSLTDKEIIDALIDVSEKGVQVDLVIRGICCLVPSNENVRVRSILGRFLEHSRVYYFSNHEHSELFIASADMMTRNTEHRIEIAAPIVDPAIKTHILDDLHLQLSDSVRAYDLDEKGNYVLTSPDGLDVQTALIEKARKTAPVHVTTHPRSRSLWQRVLNLFDR